jgi:hypothetical protein
MKSFYAAVLLLLTLSGCALSPGYGVKDKIWYAEKEQGGWVPWHVYLMFKDESHFIWWRTVDSPDKVLRNFDYYTKDSGSEGDMPVSFTRNGDQIEAESSYAFKSRTGETMFTEVYTFHGRFINEALEMQFQRTTLSPSKPPRPDRPVQWSLRRLSTLPGQ